MLARVAPDFKSWVVDMNRYLQVLATLTFLFFVFKLLRSAGMEARYIDILEGTEHVSTVLVFGALCGTTVRRAFAILIAGDKL